MPVKSKATKTAKTTEEEIVEPALPPRPDTTSTAAMAALMNGMRNMPKVLQTLGFPSLRPGQDRAVKTIMAQRDAVVILPTATGKSACFVVPTLCMGWRTIVIYPLIALMRDQATSMQRKGLAAASISSHETDAHNASVLREWASGELQFMLVSPERFSNPEWSSIVEQYPPDFVAMDECFPGDTYVPAEFGFRSMLDLWHTKEGGGKLPRVKSREDDGRISWRQVTNVFRNTPKPLITVKLVAGGEVSCTANHIWFTETGERSACALAPGDRVFADSSSVAHKARGLNDDQMQMVIGSFLGDGGFQRVSERAGTFRLGTTHGIAQAAYAGWKMDCLQGTVEPVEPVERNGYAGKAAVRCRTCVFQLPEEGAPTTGNKWGKKDRIPQWMVDAMDVRALAIWAMDDGSGVSSSDGGLQSFVFSTNSFDKQSVEYLIEILGTRFDITGHLLEHKGWSIRLRKESADRLVSLVRTHLHPDLLYKFGLAADSWGGSLRAWNNAFGPYLVEVASVTRCDQVPDYTYDLEVEATHNYFVATKTAGKQHHGYISDTSVLVHNCHTFHEWADTFRPGYKFAGEFIQRTQPKVVAAFSATLSEEAEAEVRSGLGIQDAKLVYHYPRRTNLILSSLFLDRMMDAPPWVASNCPGPTIVYASTRKRVEEYAGAIGNYTQRPVYFYHGGMAQQDRRFNQDKFMADPDAIIVATNAFGMGVDKGDIRNVVHFDIPGTLVALSQEIGRAGRDGKDSFCTIIPTPEGIRTRRHFIRCGNPTPDEVKRFFKAAVSMREGANGPIMAPRDEICQKAGIDRFASQAIMSFCLGERIFRHDMNAARQHRLRFAEVIPMLTAKQMETRDAIYDVAVDVKGWWQFDVEALAEQCAVEVTTVMSRLRAMHDSGAIEWVRSSAKKPLQVELTPDQIPAESFERLRVKAQQAEQNLQSVLSYADAADDDKHTFLEQHLNR